MARVWVNKVNLLYNNYKDLGQMASEFPDEVLNSYLEPEEFSTFVAGLPHNAVIITITITIIIILIIAIIIAWR